MDAGSDPRVRPTLACVCPADAVVKSFSHGTESLVSLTSKVQGRGPWLNQVNAAFMAAPRPLQPKLGALGFALAQLSGRFLRTKGG